MPEIFIIIVISGLTKQSIATARNQAMAKSICCYETRDITHKKTPWKSAFFFYWQFPYSYSTLCLIDNSIDAYYTNSDAV